MIRKILLVLGIFIVLLLGFLLLAPSLFKDKIQQLVIEQANQSLNAQVHLDDLALSFLKNFPKASVELKGFSIVGNAPFAGDTLVSTRSLEVRVSPWGIITGQPLKVNSLVVDQPRVLAKVLENGQANWDIALETDDTETSTSSESNFQLRLDQYEINEGWIRYQDESQQIAAEITGLMHSGSGDLTASVYDLSTETHTTSTYVNYGGVPYLNGAEIHAEVDMNVDTRQDLTVTLSDNLVRINDFGMLAEGKVSMPGEDIDLDLQFAAEEAANIKSLYSLIPGVYTEEYANIETEGSMDFSGEVVGTYNEQQFPGLKLDLVIADGTIRYPDLPQPISGIIADFHVNKPEGTDFEQLNVLLRKFHANLGSSPIDAQLELTGLERMDIAGNMNANLNLDELAKVLPLEGNMVRGRFQINADAKGVYDEPKGQFPEVDATMNMTNGYIKPADYPEAELSDFAFSAFLKDVSGRLDEAVLEVPDFHFTLGGEALKGKAHVDNFDDPTYNVSAQGKLNLGHVMKIYPIEGMDLQGLLVIDNVQTQGKLSDVEAEKYTELPTSGRVRVQNLVYQDAELPETVNIERGSAQFTPERMELSDVAGKLGSSDFQANGFIENYLAYALLEDQALTGTMVFQSNKLDLNEWMVETGAETTTSTDTVPMSVVPVPANMDLVLQANIGELTYQNFELSNLTGLMQVGDEQVVMDHLTYGLLGGKIDMSGSYSTRNLQNPDYTFHIRCRPTRL